MSESADPLAAALFAEVFMADQLARNRVSRALPKGMEISHFSVLNHLAHFNEERTPAQLAATFHVTRGAMTNTLSKLVWAGGHIHIRPPDWDDARRKFVAISPAAAPPAMRRWRPSCPSSAISCAGLAKIKCAKRCRFCANCGRDWKSNKPRYRPALLYIFRPPPLAPCPPFHASVSAREEAQGRGP